MADADKDLDTNAEDMRDSAFNEENLPGHDRDENQDEDAYVEEKSVSDFSEDEDAQAAKLMDSGDGFDSDNWVDKLASAIQELAGENTTEEEELDQLENRARHNGEEQADEGSAHQFHDASNGYGADTEMDVPADIMASLSGDSGQEIAEMGADSGVTQNAQTATTFESAFVPMEDISSSDDASDGFAGLDPALMQFEGPGEHRDDGGQADAVSSFRGRISMDDIREMMSNRADWSNNREAMQEIAEDFGDLIGVENAEVALEIIKNVLESETYDDGEYSYTITTYDDGSEHYVDSTGYESTWYPNGSYESSSSDGSWSSYDADTGSWETFDAFSGVLLVDDYAFTEEGEALLNFDGTPMTSMQYWDLAFSEIEYDFSQNEASNINGLLEGSETYKVDGAMEDNGMQAYFQEAGVSLGEDGMYTMTDDNGGTSWTSEDGMTGGYTDPESGITTQWGPEGTTYTDANGEVVENAYNMGDDGSWSADNYADTATFEDAVEMPEMHSMSMSADNGPDLGMETYDTTDQMLTGDEFQITALDPSANDAALMDMLAEGGTNIDDYAVQNFVESNDGYDEMTEFGMNESGDLEASEATTEEVTTEFTVEGGEVDLASIQGAQQDVQSSDGLG